MSDKPSVRAAKAVMRRDNESWGPGASNTPTLAEIASIIARETDCDANADIVRRLVEWHDQNESTGDSDLMMLCRDAEAALRRAGSGT